MLNVVLEFGTKMLPLDTKQRLAYLQNSIWKLTEVRDYLGKEDPLYTGLNNVILEIEAQIERIWN